MGLFLPQGYPKLDTLLSSWRSTGNLAATLEALRDEAVELARVSITEELQELSHDTSDPTDPARRQAKEALSTRLRRLSAPSQQSSNATEISEDVRTYISYHKLGVHYAMHTI